MAKNMLIDATHPEETRVVVFQGNRLEEFDYESSARRQLKGNIYLAKVTRVEPSLQAAFVDYGGNRHGFLPFSEIHPDYYRIPIADREALIAADNEADAEASANGEDEPSTNGPASAKAAAKPTRRRGRKKTNGSSDPDSVDEPEPVGEDAEVEEVEAEAQVDTVGGDEVEEASRKRVSLLHRYKIQEVIKRRQVLLVQVVKEERGNKGAALTTYLSLAGRYCVLMPNTNKGGGISRKIANPVDRRRLKTIVSELAISEGIAVIVRTAGSQRSKAEIRRDYEFLLRLWNQIREETLKSTAPTLIHEEANLIKRAIRDLYTGDMDQVLVAGDEGYKVGKAFMKSLMPSHAKNVQLYKDAKVPLFQRFQVEHQLEKMHDPQVQLKSGGYVVMNPTEALVAIDVNSGKSTRERHIEETALRTNIEAAEEVARQVRLRDLAGLIVIDFIDMEESRHNREVERKLKEAMRLDRARIQLGRISPFGLLELSRQRLRPSLFESSTVACPTCDGNGYLRSTDSTALQVLRAIEEEGVKRGGGRIIVAVTSEVAFFLLNQKRNRLVEIEQRYDFHVEIERDDSLIPPNFGLRHLTEAGDSEGEAIQARPEAATEVSTEEDGRKRRRRRRGHHKDEDPIAKAAETEPEAVAEETAAEAQPADGAEAGATEEEEKRKPRRRRGKRGGRRRSRRQRDGGEALSADGATGESATETEAGPAGSVQDVQPAAGEDAAAQDNDNKDAAKAEAPAEDATAAAKPQEKRERGRSTGGRRRGTGSRGRRSRAKDSDGSEAGPANGKKIEAKSSSADEQRIDTATPIASPSIEAPAIKTSAAEPSDRSVTPPELGPSGAEEDSQDKPKRRGWWNRFM